MSWSRVCSCSWVSSIACILLCCSFEDEGGDAFGDDIFGRFRFGNFGRSSPFQDMQNAFSGAEMMFRHMDRMFQDMHMFGDFGQIMGPNDAHGMSSPMHIKLSLTFV